MRRMISVLLVVGVAFLTAAAARSGAAYHVIVANDDGCDAPGLEALVRAATSKPRLPRHGRWHRPTSRA